MPTTLSEEHVRVIVDSALKTVRRDTEDIKVCLYGKRDDPNDLGVRGDVKILKGQMSAFVAVGRRLGSVGILLFVTALIGIGATAYKAIWVPVYEVRKTDSSTRMIEQGTYPQP